MTRERVTAEALAWIGTPYRRHAWAKGEGCDCAGLILGVGRAAGVLDFDPADEVFRPFVAWGRQPNPVWLFRALDEWAVRTSEPRPGDILLFRRGGLPQHLGLLLPDDRMIESEGPVPPRGVVAMALPAEWRRGLAGAWIYRGLASPGAPAAPPTPARSAD